MGRDSVVPALHLQLRFHFAAGGRSYSLLEGSVT
jgi:hypothetical protein